MALIVRRLNITLFSSYLFVAIYIPIFMFVFLYSTCIYPIVVYYLVIASGLLLITEMFCKLPEETTLKCLPLDFYLI